MRHGTRFLLCVFALLAAAPAHAEKTVRGQALVLDFAEDGFKNKDRPHAYWDADNDGRMEKCRWFTPGQALLAIDRDGDGLFTDSAELFGTMHMDGFAALRQLDTDNDNMLTRADRVSYPRLRAWFDGDGDGRSTPDEIKTLEQVGVIMLNLQPGKPRAHTDVALMGSYQRRGEKRTVWQPLAAVDFYCDEADTKSLTAAPPSPDKIAGLPDLHAAGELPSLHEAMARDYTGSRSLYTQVRLLSEKPLEDIFAPERPLDGWIDEILFRWAGAGEGDRARAGMNIDGRKLVFLAKVTGRPSYLQMRDPAFWDVYAAELAYRKYQAVLMAQLAAQTPAAGIFSGYGKNYDRAAGVLRGVTGLDDSALKALQVTIGRASSPAARRRIWAVVADMVDYVIGFGALTVEDGRRLDAAVQASGDPLGLRDVMNDTLALLPHEIHAATTGGQYMTVTDAAKTTFSQLLRTVLKEKPADEVWFHGTANATMKTCCVSEPEWKLTLRDERFILKDISATALAPGSLPANLGYDRVYRGERAEKGVHVIFTGYFRDERLQWSEAQMRPTTRK